jgi:hypothetical protein
VGAWETEVEGDDPVNAHRLRHGLPFGRPTALFFGLTVAAMLLWGFLSVFWFAQACSVDAWEAWIPAAATTGTMLVASRLAALDDISRATRWEASGLAALGVIGDVIITSAQHFLAVTSKDPQHVHPGPAWGGLLGGIPSLMVALLIHVGWQVYRDHSAARAAAEQARIAAAKEAERRRALAEQEQVAAYQAEQQRRAQQDEAQREADRQAAIIREQRLADEARARVLAGETQMAELKRDIEQIELEKVRQEARANRTPRSPRPPTDNGQRRPPLSPPDNGQRTTDNRTKPGPDVSDLLEPGRQVAREVAKDQLRLTRDRLQTGLRNKGYSCSTDRAIALLAALRADNGQPDPTVEGRSTTRKLSAVSG